MRLYWPIICIIDSCFLKGRVEDVPGGVSTPAALRVPRKPGQHVVSSSANIRPLFYRQDAQPLPAIDLILGAQGKPPACLVYFSAALASGEIYHSTT